MQTIQEFVAKHGLTFNFIQISRRSSDNDQWMAGSRHYKVTLENRNQTFSFEYSMGPGLTKVPNIIDVLDCLASDCSSWENAKSFEDWALDLGYDTDSRKAEKIYNTIGEQAVDLKFLLGWEAYNELLWDTERL